MKAKNTHVISKRIPALLLASLSLSGLASAETIGQEMQRQSRISDLDHKINVNERLLEIKEQELKFEKIKNGGGKRESRSGRDRNQNGNVQAQYFGQLPPGAVRGEDGQIRRLNPDGTLAEKVKSPEQIAREEAINLVNNASLREAFVPKQGGSLVGIVELNDRVIEVREGSNIQGWKVTKVALDRVEMRNPGIEGTKTIYQAR